MLKSENFKSRFEILILLFLSIAFTQTGCEWIDDPVDQIVGVLEEGINSINQNSSEWQQIMNQVLVDLEEIDDELASIVRTEVNDVLQRGIAAAGAEVRCNIDFIGFRMSDGLERIRAEQLKEEIPPIIPYFCQVVPTSVDRSLIPDRLNTLNYYGFDFDAGYEEGDLVLYLEDIYGIRTDVTDYIDIPTHYNMTINLGPNGVPLTGNHRRFILECSGSVESTVAIIQTSEVETFYPGVKKYIPPHTNGNLDFASDGPEIWCNVTLEIINGGSAIQCKIYMKGKETNKDWTTVEGTLSYTMYQAPMNRRIGRIITPTFDTEHYIDGNGNYYDIFPHGTTTLVKQFEFVGNVDGNEAGTKTGVTVEFNNVQVQLVNSTLL